MHRIVHHHHHHQFQQTSVIRAKTAKNKRKTSIFAEIPMQPHEIHSESSTEIGTSTDVSKEEEHQPRRPTGSAISIQAGMNFGYSGNDGELNASYWFFTCSEQPLWHCFLETVQALNSGYFPFTVKVAFDCTEREKKFVHTLNSGYFPSTFNVAFDCTEREKNCADTKFWLFPLEH